jgi:6-phosphogluconate dehydrogenase (decarboxylating)
VDVAIGGNVEDAGAGGAKRCRAAKTLAVAMERMADPDVQKKLARIGVSVTDSQGHFRSFLDVLTDMTPALEKMTDAKRSAFLIDAFGAHALGSVQAVLTQVTNGIRTNTGETVKGAAAVAYLRDQFENAGGTAANFRETMRRGEMLATRGVSLVDAGTSGGVWGLKNGYCMMVGGSEEAFHTVEPLLKTLAPEDGYLRVGACGAGHYVKMIHNGIEYGMMQAYAEGFDILQSSPFHLPVEKIAHLWNQGSVVRSWLLELVERMLQANPKLDGIKGYVPDSGEGRWTVEEAINLSIPAPILTMSLITRFRSRQEDLYADRFLAALRNQFGGHEVKKR